LQDARDAVAAQLMSRSVSEAPNATSDTPQLVVSAGSLLHKCAGVRARMRL
jgi:hypothetical protein